MPRSRSARKMDRRSGVGGPVLGRQLRRARRAWRGQVLPGARPASRPSGWPSLLGSRCSAWCSCSQARSGRAGARPIAGSRGSRRNCGSRPTSQCRQPCAPAGVHRGRRSCSGEGRPRPWSRWEPGARSGGWFAPRTRPRGLGPPSLGSAPPVPRGARRPREGRCLAGRQGQWRSPDPRARPPGDGSSCQRPSRHPGASWSCPRPSRPGRGSSRQRRGKD